MYNAKSSVAQEFINHEEILSTIEYAKKNKNNYEMILEILQEAEQMNGISHRQAAVLLECDDEEILAKEKLAAAEENENSKKEFMTNDKVETKEEIKVALKTPEKETKTEESAGGPKEQKNVLVLCAGGGTSGLLANALKKAAKEYNEPIDAAAGAYGAHYDMMKDYDLIVLAPQVASNYEDIKKDTDKLGIKLVKTQGAEYIKLTRDPKGSLEFVKKQFEN